MVWWPLVEAGRAWWSAVSGFAQAHPVLATALVLSLAGMAVVLFVERE